MFQADMQLFTQTFIRLFFLFVPFFGLTMFISLTRRLPSARRKKIAWEVALAVFVIGSCLFFFGKYIFDLFGITIDSFRIGAGSLLFLSSISLVNGANISEDPNPSSDQSISVVPLAMPITIGPASTGALLVMGANLKELSDKMVAISALFAASFAFGLILYAAPLLERVLGNTGLTILTRLTGLILSALAAQLVFTGIQNFMQIAPVIAG